MSVKDKIYHYINYSSSSTIVIKTQSASLNYFDLHLYEVPLYNSAIMSHSQEFHTMLKADLAGCHFWMEKNKDILMSGLLTLVIYSNMANSQIPKTAINHIHTNLIARTEYESQIHLT